MIPQVGSSLRRSVRIARERPRAALWTLLALSCALFAVGLAAIAADNVDRWAQHRGGGASMVVYLGEGVDPSRADQLLGELRGLAGVERAELVSPADTTERLRRALGSDAALLDGVEPASLPASVEVTLAPGVRDVVAMSPTVRALHGASGVDDVVVEDAGDERTAGVLRTIRVVAWTGAMLFSGLALLIVLAAIRVRLDRSRRDVAVADLLGASPSFTVIPTALAGALQGVVAALVAAIALWAALHRYSEAIVSSITPAIGPVELIGPGAVGLVVFLLGGGALGLAGGALAGASRVAR
ncbi:MAG: cell division protein FtsX [Kofleriaceae bacterium]